MNYLTRILLIGLLSAILGASCDCTQKPGADAGDASDSDDPEYPPGGGPLYSNPLTGDGEVPDGLDETSLDEIALLDDLVGYGDGTNGGAEGWIFLVTSLADTGPGTLREGLESPYPLWILFSVDGEINLAASISIESNKTIDGRNATMVIKGEPLLIKDGATNVIIESVFLNAGLEIDGDDVSNVWIDHVSFGPAAAPGLRVVGGATDITISWSDFVGHSSAIIVGAGTTADELAANADSRVTLHHSFLSMNEQANPLVHGAQVHAFHNYIQDWTDWGMGVRYAGGLFVEGNIYEAGNDSSASATDFLVGVQPGYVRSENNWFIGDAQSTERYPANALDPNNFYLYDLVVGGGDIRDQLMTDILASSGPQ